MVKTSIAAIEEERSGTAKAASRRRGTSWSARPEGTLAGPGQLALVLILLASFMVVLDFSIVNVALASIQRDLGFAASSVQWVVTGYAITFGGLLVLGGRAADLFGRRRIFLVGLVVFSLASLSGGLAEDPVLLVASRLVQGGGAAMVAPAALSLITTNFKEGQARNRALGAYGAVASLGFVSGQVLGGVLVEFITWRSVFLVNVPVGLAVVLLGPRVLPESRLGGSAKHLDIGGAFLITAGVAFLVYAVSETGAVGAGSPLVFGGFAFAVLALAGFLAVERRHPAPLVPLRLLHLPNLRRANLMMALMGLWNGGELIVLSLYMQDSLHDSPLITGLAVAPQGVIGFTAGAFGARLLRRVGIKWLNVLTAATALVGFLVLTQLPTSGSYGPALAAVTLVGFGTAGIAFASTVEASMGMDDADQGFVGGAVNTSRQIGAAVGASLLPAVAEAVGKHGQVASITGDSAAMLVAAVAAGVAVLVALRTR
ncbi:MAG: MFS transporter [Acidimicrobiales bacterium]|jgi:EmrB/QacA subfamily drug resistance transporter